MMLMKPIFCRSKSKTLPKLEKILVDKGREFAGEFFQFYQKYNIGLYSTHSETKSVFAKRNSRSLKLKVFKILHENSTDTYFCQFAAICEGDNLQSESDYKAIAKHVGKKDALFLIFFSVAIKFAGPITKWAKKWE